MKIILTGGGIGEKAVDAFSVFSSYLPNKKVLYIPLADDEMSLEENVAWIKSELQPYGISNLDVVASADEITEERLENTEGVFIGGGNAFQLLNCLKSGNAFNILKKYFKSNKVFLGTSAGATIFGEDINSCLKDDLNIAANDKNKIGLTNTKGYNLIKNYSFFVHYKLKVSQLEQTEQKVKRILDLGTNVVCLPEESNLLITEQGIKVFGKKPIEISTKFERRIIYPGETLEIDDVNYEVKND